MRHYATAPRERQLGPLVQSLHRHCEPFTLHVLAYDFAPSVDGWGDDQGRVKITRWSDLTAKHPELLEMPGEPRSAIDELCTARWTFYADLQREHGAITGVDGDLAFWSNDAAIYDEIGGAGAAVSPHRFLPAAAVGIAEETHRQYGLYNTGWVYLASASHAEFMARATLEWSYSRVRLLHGRPDYGDQGALERMVDTCGAHVVRHEGLNVGPWNIHRYRFEEAEDRRMMVNRRWPLVAYHYSSLRFLPGSSRVAQLADKPYEVERHPDHLAVYEPYVRDLSRWARSA